MARTPMDARMKGTRKWSLSQRTKAMARTSWTTICGSAQLHLHHHWRLLVASALRHESPALYPVYLLMLLAHANAAMRGDATSVCRVAYACANTAYTPQSSSAALSMPYSSASTTMHLQQHM